MCWELDNCHITQRFSRYNHAKIHPHTIEFWTDTYYFNPMPGRIQPIRSRESHCVFCGTPQLAVEYIVFHKSFPAFITASKFSNRTPGCVRRHLLFRSVWILRMQNQIILSNSTLSSLSLPKNLILEGEYFMQTSSNLRNIDRNPGTVEKRQKSFD